MFVCMLLCVYVCYVCHTDSSTTIFIAHECIAYYACVNVGVCKKCVCANLFMVYVGLFAYLYRYERVSVFAYTWVCERCQINARARE